MLGICDNTLGLIPLINPFRPYISFIILNASKSPLQFLTRMSLDVPLVCNKVLATSSGVVAAAAIAPANPPAIT